MNCFHLGGRAFHSRSLPLTQQGCAALNKTPAGERHTKKASLLQRSRHLHTSAFHSRTRPRPAHSSDASRAPTLTYALSHVFDSRATHARTLLPAALASVPFGFVLVRVRVRFKPGKPGVFSDPDGRLNMFRTFVSDVSDVLCFGPSPFLVWYFGYFVFRTFVSDVSDVLYFGPSP